MGAQAKRVRWGILSTALIGTQRVIPGMLKSREFDVAAMDVLAPGIGEIIGGSQREERLDMLDIRMAELGINTEHYGWYRDLRRYGTVPHAGFGLGFERTLAYVTGLANVRDAIPFPRTPGNARF